MKYKILAIYFLVLQFLLIYRNYGSPNSDLFFWFCNHVPLLFAIGFFLNKTQFVKSLINIGLLGQLIWTIDFLSKLIFGFHLFNITNYLFQVENTFWIIITIAIHMLTSTVALYFTYKIKPTKKAYYYSAYYILIIYILTLLFTNPENNVNWIYEIGLKLNYSSVIYSILWPVLTFIVLVIPTQYLQKSLYKLFVTR